MSLTRTTGTPSHNVLLEQVKHKKRQLLEMIESGSRDFVKQRALLEEYAHFQLAADLVSGQDK